MQISYDRNLKVAGIALVPWNRLGPEQWLPNYAVASLYGWGLPDNDSLPPLYSLQAASGLVGLERFNSQNLLQTEAFQNLLNDRLSGYDLLTYKPVRVPEPLQGHKFIMIDKAVGEQFENKAWLRQNFADLPFPPFRILERDQLPTDEAGFEALMDDRHGLVIQDEQLSGGKGTFIVRSYKDYERSIKALNQRSARQQVVVSDLVTGAKERSVQCCVTKDGVFTGPLQRQIVRHPELCHLRADGDKFCGAVISQADQDTGAHQTAIEVAQAIGQQLKNIGYRGVFGIDFLLNEQDELFVIEVNPRLTGVTPLLTAMHKPEQVPFYLLHILELGGYEYQITDAHQSFSDEGSLLVMHSLENSLIEIKSVPASGTYHLNEGRLERISDNVRLQNLRQTEFVLQNFAMPGMQVKPGGRLIALQFNELVLDNNTDKLYNTVSQTIATVYEAITFNPVNP